jgi:aspartate/methionine/tyrosine aminotransferase
MRIASFRIEKYFALHEFTAPHLLSSSDAECVSIADILALEPDAADRLFSQQLRYTQSEGGPELRAAASAIYKIAASQDIVVVSAAEEGIFAAYHALLQPGDHVVVETPCYESALQLARSTGANVAEWRRSADTNWAHDLAALERAFQPNTRLIYINTPHNSTGLMMPCEVLDRVIELCAARNAWLAEEP